MKTRLVLFVGLMMLLPLGVSAQYDARQLTGLYHMTLRSRILTERILTDVVLLDNKIKPAQSREKLLTDLHDFQDLSDRIIGQVPKNDPQLPHLFKKWKNKSDQWIATVNAFAEKGKNVKDIFKLVKSINSSYQSLKAHLELLLGFSQEQLDNFSRLTGVYIDTERSFAAYVLQRSDAKHVYEKNYKDASGKWNSPINALLKLRKQVGKKGELRRQINLLLTDLVFFNQAQERNYDPLMIYAPFLKFDAKYDRLYELVFKSSQWI